MSGKWKCPHCRCRTYARVDERKDDGSFGPGPEVRCVECKSAFTLAANPITPEALERMEEVAKAPDWPATFDTPVILSLIASARRAAELEAALEVAEGALTKGVSWFVEYAHGHEAKIPPDTDKADRNFGRARMLDFALTTIRQAMGRGS